MGNQRACYEVEWREADRGCFGRGIEATSQPSSHVHPSSIMATPGPNIYQWLQQVSKEDLPAVQRANDPAKALEMDAAVETENPPSALEEPPDLEMQPIPRIRHSSSLKGASHDWKRARELRSPSHTPGTDSKNQYERRPRHKTRKDRYDYKTPKLREKHPARSDERKPKRSKARKHTINEDFHASNVAPRRLTLRSSTKTGIFSKGKASSLTIARGGLGFSEAAFLSCRSESQAQQQASSSRLMNTPRQKDRHQFDYPRFDTEAPTDLEDTNILLDSRSARVDTQARRTIEESTASLDQPERQPAQGNFEGISQTECERKIPGHSRPATPYTWSMTEESDSHQGRAIEAHLMSLLRVGLFSRRNSEEHNSTRSKSDCCDIEELKWRLQDRKTHWQVGTDETRSSDRRAKDLDCNQQHKNPSRLSIQPSLASLMASMTGKAQSQKTAKSVADQVSRDADTEPRCRIPVSGAHELQPPALKEPANLNENDMGGAYPASDEAFFNMLDMAFDAIMNPEAKRSNPSQEIPQKPEVSQYHVSSQPTDPLKLTLEVDVPLFSDSVDANPQGPYCTGNPRPSGLAVHDRAHGRLEPSLEAESRDLAIGIFGEEIVPQRYNIAGARHPGQRLPSPAANSHAIPSTIPAGFWRQNKLY